MAESPESPPAAGVGARGSVWSRGSVNRKILQAAISVGSFTLLVKIASMAKELVVAATFGTGDAIDAYLIALVFPSFLITVVAGSFHSAFIPTYVRVRESEGIAAAQRLFGAVLCMGLVVLGLVVALAAAIAPVLMEPLSRGFGPEKRALTVQLFQWLIPITLIRGATSIGSGVLNAGERFALAAAAPMAVPTVTVLALLALGHRIGVQALVLGTVGGYVVEFLWIGYALHRKGLAMLPRWDWDASGIGDVLRQYLPMAAGAFLMSGMVLVDQAMAAMLEAGSVATLGYGQKIVALVLGIGSLGLGTAVLPYFSKMTAAGDWAGLRVAARSYVGLIVATAAPVAALIYLGSEPLTRLLFERGNFTASDTTAVAAVQALYALQLPFYLVNILVVRFIAAARGNVILLAAAAIDLPLNVILNYVLMHKFGVAGIALATTIVYMVTLVFTSSCAYIFLWRGER